MNRREFMQQATVLSLGGLALSACTKKEAALSCEDTAGLDDASKMMRSTLKYSDKSPDAAKLCKGCNFFQAAATPNTCGGCTLLKGKIHPDGYCTSWVAKA